MIEGFLVPLFSYYDLFWAHLFPERSAGANYMVVYIPPLSLSDTTGNRLLCRKPEIRNAGEPSTAPCMIRVILSNAIIAFSKTNSFDAQELAGFLVTLLSSRVRSCCARPAFLQHPADSVQRILAPNTIRPYTVHRLPTLHTEIPQQANQHTRREVTADQ